VQANELIVARDLQILFDKIRPLLKRESIGFKRVLWCVGGRTSMCDENFSSGVGAYRFCSALCVRCD
jgi:hypothetical protein